jgi:hypothetical protein
MSDGLYGTPENPDSGFIHTTLAFFNEVRQDRIDTGKRMAGYDALATLVKKRVNLMTVAVVSGAGSIIIAALSPVVAHYVSTIIGVTK